MTLPKKGRRTIHVDRVAYQYLVRFEQSERIVIQHASGRGPCLFVFPHAIMKPKHVSDAIRFAMSKGWQPETGTRNLWIAFDTDVGGNSLFEHIPDDDFRVITYATHGKLPEGMNESEFADTRPWYHRPVVPDGGE